MELYHRTLLQPNTHSMALALHLNPIKPKEEQEKPRQLLLCSNSTLSIYRMGPSSQPSSFKLEAKLLQEEQLFNTICAADAIIYQDEDLRKDIVIVTLANGKYQLLEWMPNKSHFSVIHQNLIFRQESQVLNGLTKPPPGHYIAVNNDAKLVMIASAQWECKIYSIGLGYQGIRLMQLAYFQKSRDSSLTSVCLGIAAGQSSFLFYSLRKQLKQGQKQLNVYKIKQNQQQFQEESMNVKDPSVHMLIPRSTEGNFFLVGERFLYYTNKNKQLSQIKIPQYKPSLQSTWWRRPLRQKKQEFFLLNQHGEFIVVNYDESNLSFPCSAHIIEVVAPGLQVAVLEKNLFFLLTVTHQHLLIQAIGKYKIDDRIEKTRSSSKLKEEKEKEEAMIKGNLKEFQVVGTMPAGRVIRDMKICNVQKSMNNQILLTGGRPNSKKGFLSVIKYGLKLKSHLSISCTPPIGIWSLKKHIQDKYNSYVVLTFPSRKTSTFHYEASKLVPNTELRLDENEITLHTVRFFDNSLVQVVPSKLKYINKDGIARDISIKGRIMKAVSVNEGRQLFVALVGGFMEYYQVMGGELKKIKEATFQAQANHIEFSPPEMVQNKLVSKFLAAGLINYHIQIYAVSSRGFESISVKRNFKVSIQSLVFVPQGEQQFCIYVGGNQGKSFKWTLSKSCEPLSIEEEKISEQRTIKYSKINIQGKPALFRMSPQPSLTYQWQGQPQTCAIPLPPVQNIEDISLEGITGALFITYYDNYLRFIELNGFGNLLYSSDKDLQYTGRKIVILEQRLGLGLLTEVKTLVEDKPAWACRFLFLNPLKDYEEDKNIVFEPNQKVLSVATYKDDKILKICFGCVMGHSNIPESNSHNPIIKIYAYEKNENEILVSHLFNFQVDYPPTAMDVYFNKLLVGVGRKLMLFEICKQKLVLRAISDTLSSPICSINVSEQKIFLTQVMESFSLMKINHKNKCLELVGQDFLDRFTTCSCLLDGEAGVMAGGDKFGNFFVSKMSQRMKADLQEIKDAGSEMINTPNYMDSLINYNLGQVPTAIQCGKVDLKKPERIFYATIDGRVGMFYPLEGEEENELILLKRLEEEMSSSSLSGATNYKLYHSQFSPVKGVVDGDFCSLFQSLSEVQKIRLCTSMGKDPKEIKALLAYMQSKFS